jgi:integrase
MSRRRYQGNLEQLATGYRYRVTIHGKPYRCFFGTLDEQEAVDFAIQKYAELHKQAGESRRRGPVEYMRFSALLARYKSDRLPLLAEGTQRSYRHALDAAREYFEDDRGDPLVDRINSLDISDFLAWRRTRPRGRFKKRGRPLDTKTLRKSRSILVAVFNYAVEIGAVEHNPVLKVAPPKSDDREPIILSVDQYDALVAACTDPMVRMYVLMLGESGVRSESEALFLQWTDIDLEAGRAEIVSGRDGHRTKGGRSRRVPLTARLMEALRDHFAVYRFSGSPWVFHHVRRQGHAKAGERIRSLRRAVEGTAKRAGIPAGFRQHDLRHRRVTKWLAEGASIVHVQHAVGHQNIATTERYTHLVDQHVDALLEHEAARGKSVARLAAKARKAK